MKKIKSFLSIFILFYYLFVICMIPEALAKTVKLTPQIDTWTLYTFGNGDVIASIMFGLQSLIKSNVFIQLINLIMLIGFGWLILSHITNSGLIFTNAIKYIVFTSILLRMLFSLTISIGLIDSINPEYNQVINSVPFLMGAPACFLSAFGHIVAAELDEAYSQHTRLPLSLTMTGGSGIGASGAPFSIVAQMLMDGAEYTIQDPFLKNSLTHFMVDCVTPLISNGHINTHQLLRSDNIWNLLDASQINPAIMTVYYDHEGPSFLGEVKTCRQAYTALNHDLQIEKPSFIKKWSSSITTSAAASLFQTILSYTARQSQYTPTPANYLQQAALLSILQEPSLNLMALQTNSPLLIQRLSTQQAIKSAKTNWSTTAAVFQATFGYLYAALQVLVYAMAPMATALMILPGLRVLIMRRYLQLLAWFPVTLILLAVTNDILLYWSEQTLSQVWRDQGGLSLLGAPFISTRAANMAAVGGWLITLVPMISWGLVSGFNLAINNLLSTTGIQTLGTSAATQTVTGNIALNNQNYDNTATNKLSTPMKTDIGAIPFTSYASSTHITQEGSSAGFFALKNSTLDMQSVHHNKQRSEASFDTNIQDPRSQQFSSNMAAIPQSADASTEAINKITPPSHIDFKDDKIADTTTTYLQNILSDRNNHQVIPKQSINKKNNLRTAENLQTSAHLASSNTENLKKQGNLQEVEGFIKKSGETLRHAFHTLGDGLGGGTAGNVAAGALLGMGLAGAATSIIAGLPEAAMAAEATEIIQSGELLGSSISKVVSRLASTFSAEEKSTLAPTKQMAKMLLGKEIKSNLAEAITASKINTIKNEATKNIWDKTSEVMGTAALEPKFLQTANIANKDDGHKTSNVNLAASANSAKLLAHQKQQKILNQSANIQEQINSFNQRIFEKNKTVQFKDLLNNKQHDKEKTIYPSDD